MHVCMQYATAPNVSRIALLCCPSVCPTACGDSGRGQPDGCGNGFLSRPYYHVFVPIRSLSWHIDRFRTKTQETMFLQGRCCAL
jgi:hypothetical protein